jgi:acetolactate synthase-1/2/3 large subunit
MENLVSVDDGAEAFVELLCAHGVDYVFLNPGSDIFPIQEALTKFKALGKPAPEIILCLHESVAMAAAHGYAMVTGRPQVVLVHVDVGTQQVGGALHNAQRCRIPVILCAGKTPSTLEGVKRGGRSHMIHWIQEQYDNAGIVRNYTKWEYDLRYNENIHNVVHRAFQIASTEPCGPVYLSLPKEVIMEQIDKVTLPPVARYAAPSTPQADLEILSEVAEVIMHAKEPLIITGHTGRHPQSVASLVAVAETLGARVSTSDKMMNFPTNHPLCAGLQTSASLQANLQPYLRKADVILIFNSDIPFIPGPQETRKDAKIIHIDIDPVKKDIPLWDLPVDILIEADTSKVLPLLNDMIKDKMTPELQKSFRQRFEQIEAAHQKLRAERHDLAMKKADESPISPEWLAHCINEAVDDDTIILHDLITNSLPVSRQLHRSKPGTLFGNAGSSLGWTLGAALGAKLAAPENMVVSLMGDGGFAFGCPTAALWTANTFHAPFLSIIFNNQAYNAVKGMIRGTYGDNCYSEKTGSWVGANISPPPDYALIAEACHGYGKRVEEPSDLMPALKDALEQVRNGKAAVLDVRIASR